MENEVATRTNFIPGLRNKSNIICWCTSVNPNKVEWAPCLPCIVRNGEEVLLDELDGIWLNTGSLKSTPSEFRGSSFAAEVVNSDQKRLVA